MDCDKTKDIVVSDQKSHDIVQDAEKSRQISPSVSMANDSTHVKDEMLASDCDTDLIQATDLLKNVNETRSPCGEKDHSFASEFEEHKKYFSKADLLHLRTHFFEIIEELKMKKESEKENEERLHQLMNEKHIINLKYDECSAAKLNMEQEHVLKFSNLKKKHLDDLKELEENKLKLEMTVDVQDKEVKYLKDDIRNLKMEKYSLEKQLRDQQRRLQMRDTVRDTNIEQHVLLENMCKDMVKRMDRFVKEQERLEKNVSESQKINRNLAYLVKHHECESKAYKEEISHLRSSLLLKQKEIDTQPRELEDLVAEKEEIIKDLQQDKSSQEDMISSLKSQLVQAQQTVKKTETQLKESSDLLSRHVSSANQKAEEVSKLQADLTQLNESYIMLKTNLEDIVKELGLEKASHENASSKWKVKEEELNSGLKKLQADYENLTRDHASLEELNTKWSMKNTSLVQEVSSLKEELSKPKADAEVQTEICVHDEETQVEVILMDQSTQTVFMGHDVDNQTDPLWATETAFSQTECVLHSDVDVQTEKFEDDKNTFVNVMVQTEEDQTDVKEVNVSPAENIGSASPENIIKNTDSASTENIIEDQNIDRASDVNNNIAIEYSVINVPCDTCSEENQPAEVQELTQSESVVVFLDQKQEGVTTDINNRGVNDQPHFMSVSAPVLFGSQPEPMIDSCERQIDESILESNSEPIISQYERISGDGFELDKLSPYSKFTGALSHIASMFNLQKGKSKLKSLPNESPSSKKRKLLSNREQQFLEDNSVTGTKSPGKVDNGNLKNSSPVTRSRYSFQFVNVPDHKKSPTIKPEICSPQNQLHGNSLTGILQGNSGRTRHSKRVSFANKLEEHNDSPPENKPRGSHRTLSRMSNQHKLVPDDGSLFSEDEEGDQFELGSQVEHIASFLDKDGVQSPRQK